MPDLPTVEETFEANVAPFVASVLEARDALLEAAAAAATFQEIIDGLHGKDITINVETATAGATAAAAAVDGLTAAEVGLAAAQAQTSDSGAGAAAAIAATGAAAQGTTVYFGGWLGAIRAVTGANIPLFGGILGTVGGLHLLADAVLEVATVVIPAAVALAAFGVAGADAFKAVYTQVSNMHTVMDATGQAIYPFTGALEALHKAVQPQVYQLFGDAIQIAGRNTGVFSQLATGAASVVDQLATRFTVAVTTGTTFQVFLSHAVTDLAKLGDIVGNLGGVLGNVFKAVPGYAQTLLNLADAGSKVLEWASRVGEPVIAAGLAIHGAFLYAGLGVTLLARMIPGALTGISNLALKAATAAEGSRVLGAAGDRAGAGLLSLAGGAETAAALPWGWILLAAAGIGVLTYAILSAKDATQQWLSSMQGAMQAASGFKGISMLMADQGAVTERLVQAQNALAGAQQHVVVSSVAVGHGFGVITNNVQAATTRVQELTSGQRMLADQAQLVADRVAVLGGQFSTTTQANMALTQQGTTLGQVMHQNAGAMGLLLAAGVPMNLMLNKSSEAWAEIKSMVMATTSAYQAMGQTGGRIGADMTVLNTLASDQRVAMGNLNQAWDTYTNVAITGMQAAIKSASGFKTLASDAKATGASFTGVGNASLTLRGDLEQQLTSVQQTIDSMRTAGASAKDMGEVVSTFLSPAVKAGALDFSGYRDQIYAAARQAGYAGPNAIGPLTNYLHQNSGSLQDATNKASRYAGQNVSLQGAVSSLTTSINALIRTMGGVPPGVKTNFTTPGLSQALASGYSFNALLDGIPRNVDVHVTTFFNSVGSASIPGGGPGGHGGPLQAGTMAATAGFHLVGERGPEMVLFGGGERVLNNADTRRFMNSPGSFGHPTPNLGGGGAGPVEATIHNNVYLDGQQVWNSVRTETLKWNQRNGNPQSGAMGRAQAPGA